jgi:hypothetical protein
MHQQIYRLLFISIFVIAFTGVAAAQDTHSVWSKKPLIVQDGRTGAEHKVFEKGNAVFGWTEPTMRAYAHAFAVISPSLNYDFMLIKATSSSADGIDGLWDVRRNGVLVCHNCIGKAYLLGTSPTPPGNYFKIYVGTPTMYAEKWLYSGDKTERFDF